MISPELNFHSSIFYGMVNKREAGLLVTESEYLPDVDLLSTV